MKRPRLFSTALCLLIGLFGITAQADMTLDEVTARLKPMDKLPKLTSAWGARKANRLDQLEDKDFMLEWVRVTGTYGLRYDATPEHWAAVRAANPRAYTVNMSPFGRGNGSFRSGAGKLLYLDRGKDPTKWVDFSQWLMGYRAMCIRVGEEARGIPVYLLMDYEHGAHWPDQSRLLGRLNVLVRYARIYIPHVTVIWYQQGNAHHRDAPHPQWLTAHVVPEGVLCGSPDGRGVWNVQLYELNDALLCNERVQRAVSQHPHWRGSAWIQIGTPSTIGHPDRLEKFARELYGKRPDAWGFRYIDTVMLWPEQGEWLDEETGEKRGVDWETLLTFFEAAQPANRGMKERHPQRAPRAQREKR